MDVKMVTFILTSIKNSHVLLKSNLGDENRGIRLALEGDEAPGPQQRELLLQCERECECVCVCGREKDRESECVCVCERERDQAPGPQQRELLPCRVLLAWSAFWDF